MILSLLKRSPSLRELDQPTILAYHQLFKRYVHLVHWASNPEDGKADIIGAICTQHHTVHVFITQGSPIFTSVDTFVELLMTDNPWDAVLTLTDSWLICASEIMQMILDGIFPSLNPVNKELRTKCLVGVQKIARSKMILPPRMVIDNLKRVGKNPVDGGGFADVWKGTVQNDQVCLKVLRIFTSNMDRQKLFKSLAKEVVVWRQLKHPNVLPFLGVNFDEFAPSFCLVSPWLSQGTVLQFISKNPNHNRVQLLIEISQGLQYLHEMTPPVVHGDIRTANILVKEDGVCCLSDFGLAVFAEMHVSWTTSSNTIQGANRWLAPELFDPTHKLESSTTRDIYALGCTMYEMYSGKPPFWDIRQDTNVRAMVLEGSRPPHPTDSPQPMPSFVYDLAQKCWHKEPNSRPEIAAVLASLSNGE